MANRKRKQQKLTNQRETHRFFKEGTVASAPVHRGAGVKPGDGNTEALLDTLNNLAGMTADISKDRIARLKEAGMVAAARGGQKPDDIWGGKAYEVANGMASKTTFKTYMATKESELFRENPKISQREFESKMRKHGNAFTSDKSDHFVVGLSDTMLEVDGSLSAVWQEHDTTRIQVEGKTSLSQMAIDAADEVSSVPGLTSEERAKLLRTKMNDIYMLADIYRLEKPDLTGHLTKVLGEKYVAEGAPHKLSWMVMADNSGIVPSQTKDGIAAEDYIRQATAVQNQMIANKENEFKLKKEQAKMQLGQDLIEAANTLAPNDAEGWAKERAKLVKYKTWFTPKELKSYYATLDLMQDPGNFSRIGDDLEVQQELRLLARKGELDLNRLNRNTASLTKPTYTKILNEQLSAMSKAEGKQGTSTRSTKIASQLNKLETSFLAMSGATVSKTGELIAGLSGDPRKRRFLRTLQQKWMHYTVTPKDFMDKDGRLDEKKITALEERIYKEVQADYGDLVSKLTTIDKAAATPGFEPKSKEQAKQLSAIERLKKSQLNKKEE